MANEILLELDARRRVSFGKIGRPEHTRYLARENSDGTVTLTPAVVMSETEARFWSDPEFAARIIDSQKDPKIVRRSVPSLDQIDPAELEF